MVLLAKDLRFQEATQDSLAERSKAVAQGAIPKGRGFEPHSCHFFLRSCARARHADLRSEA